MKIPMTVIAQQFIKLFDGFRFTPRLRLVLPEFEFRIDIPGEVIEQINIDEVRELGEKADAGFVSMISASMSINLLRTEAISQGLRCY